MIEKDDIQKLTDLALVDMSETEIEKIQGEIKPILDYVSELQKLSAQDLEPAVGDIYNIMRDDANPHESGLHTEALLKELPQREGDYVKVKKILTNQ